MKEKELQEALKQLEEQGWNPMICDTPVPLFDGHPERRGRYRKAICIPASRNGLPQYRIHDNG